MLFKEELEQQLEQIQILTESFRKVREMEIIPLSFFSSSYDILKQLTNGVHHIETMQLQLMKEHLEKSEVVLVEPEAVPVKKEIQNTIIQEPNGQNPVPEIQEPEPEMPVHPVIEATRQEPVPVKEPISSGFLGDKIGKQLFADFRQSLSLNDRFRFQRDLFGGNAMAMNAALDQINGFNTLPEAFDFLDNLFHWDWEQESAAAFKELLEKRFI